MAAVVVVPRLPSALAPAGDARAERERMTTLVLPYPISANRYWTQFTLNGRQMMAPSKEAKAYKREVAWLARAAGIREPIKGRVRVCLYLYPARPQDAAKRAQKDPMNWDDSVRCIDLDNARKCLYDAMKDIVFEDDRWVWSDGGERMEPDGPARVVVTVEPIVRNSRQPALFQPP